MDYTNVIIKPIQTEKATDRLALNQYSFEVDRKATKRDIRRAVEEMFKVEVYRVRVINRRGKGHAVGPTRRRRVRSTRRYAVVTINPKQKIDIFGRQEEV